MAYPVHFSGLEPLTEEEARRAIILAVTHELRYLCWAPWKKGMTVETVLKQMGVETFANNVATRLTSHGVAMLKAPPVPVRFFPVPPNE